MLVANYQSHKSLTGQLGSKIREKELKIAKSTKYLGIYVDQNLNWKKHIKETSNKRKRFFLRSFKKPLHQHFGT